MISTHIDGHRFQLRAAAVFVHEGAVLLHRAPGDDFWALPGGRVEAGEDAATTVFREMQEELGEAVQCERLLYTVEAFFHHLGSPNHEIGLYFLTHLPAHSPLLDKQRTHAGIEADKSLEFAWFRLGDLGDVNVCPSFLQTALTEPGLPFRHVVQRD
ncbi:MAG: NUDIX domain-containing protein [Moraxellaceae bacterium]|nr:NUDIX domain-containing protein [Moraxellaceae bacterium]